MTEAQIQKAVFANLRERARPGVVYWHTPNDKSSRSKSGYRAGVSDVACVWNGSFYAIELKKDGGHPTEDQMTFVSDINKAGGFACIAEGLDQALCILESWGLLRGAA